MKNTVIKWKYCFVVIAALLLLLCAAVTTHAQVYAIRDGKMYIKIDRKISSADLDSFIVRYELADLDLKNFIKTNQGDSLIKLGWHIDLDNEISIAITKPLISSEDLSDVADKIIFTSRDHDVNILFPAVDNGINIGVNKFKGKSDFAGSDSVTTFYLRNYLDARHVSLAGSFNNWDPGKLKMIRTDSGWIAEVKLGPGKYWYKFIVDGNWMLDNDNQLRENDGQGNTNSIYFKTNYVFRLSGFQNAKRVYLAGSFNKWKPREIQLKQSETGWELPVYLANGTHTYKYIVDGNWIEDPGNPDHYPNEFNSYNSVIHLGKPYMFRLQGFPDAKKVLLAGSFNYWRKDELFMERVGDEWQLAYALGPGNYEYFFVVDGKQIPDPANPCIVKGGESPNSYLALDSNYTFRLKGYPDAKEVILSGDFNNFNPNSLTMKKVGDEWIFSLHLNRGKHIYKFIVDGKWILDPANPQWEQNRYGTGDSVIWIGE